MIKRRELKEKKNDAVLPQNRIRLLMEIMRYDFALIADGGLLCALFSLPLIAVWTIAYFILIGGENITQQAVFSIFFYFGLISVPLFSVRYLARGAIFELYKKRAFNEGCFILDSFKNAIKQNLLRYALLGGGVGISFFAAAVGCSYFVIFANNAFAKGIGIGVCFLQLALCYSVCDVCLAQNCIYKLRLCDLIKNGISFTLMSFLPAILYFALSVMLPLWVCTLSIVAATAALLLYVTVADGFFAMVATLYCQRLFDLFINKENYPHLVGRGLYTDKE